VVTDAEALAKVAEDDEMMADVLKVHAPTKGCHRMVHQHVMLQTVLQLFQAPSPRLYPVGSVITYTFSSCDRPLAVLLARMPWRS